MTNAPQIIEHTSWSDGTGHLYTVQTGKRRVSISFSGCPDGRLYVSVLVLTTGQLRGRASCGRGFLGLNTVLEKFRAPGVRAAIQLAHDDFQKTINTTAKV